MELYTFIVVYGIFCPWLFLFSYIFYIALCFDDSFIYIIFNKAQLRRYWFFLAYVVSFTIYLFFVRLRKMGLSVDVFLLKQLTLSWIGDQNWLFLILGCALLFRCLFLGFLVTKWIALIFRRTCFALYLYYYQYKFFREKICSGFFRLSVAFNFYFESRVNVYTKHPYIEHLAYKIWPGLFYRITPKLFTFLLPYVCVFDYITLNGTLTHIFLILPWYYLLFILRASIKLFFAFFKYENHQISLSIYKSQQVLGKPYRWVEEPENLQKSKLLGKI